MVRFLIGAGGWDYFNVPGDKLHNYAKAFKTVEVNSIFYRIPPIPLIRSWRRRVPHDFEFTVRCNGELIRRIQLDTLDSSIELFDRITEICSILKANILHIQIPAIFQLGREGIEKIENFLSVAAPSNLRLAWEIRGNLGINCQKLLSTLKRHNVIHCVDFSREKPAYESDIIYSRLFGSGVHNIYQFTDSELEEIWRRVKESKAEKAYLNFHGVKMYKDAARLRVFEATGVFPKVTRETGVDAVLEVLREDIKFPVSISELVKTQGWKVCEWTENRQLHISEVLSKVEETTFRDVQELETALQKLKSF